MSRPCILYIAASLDGYIATEDHSLQWLFDAAPSAEPFGYEDFIGGCDTVLMGRNTYDWVLNEGQPDPYPGLQSYVFTSRPAPAQAPVADHLRFTSEDPVAVVRRLKSEPGKSLFLVGGSKLNTALLEAGLIDEIRLAIVPVFLGGGIPMFARPHVPTWFECTEVRHFPGGMMMGTWVRRATLQV